MKEILKIVIEDVIEAAVNHLAACGCISPETRSSIPGIVKTENRFCGSHMRLLLSSKRPLSPERLRRLFFRGFGNCLGYGCLFGSLSRRVQRRTLIHHRRGGTDGRMNYAVLIDKPGNRCGITTTAEPGC